MGVSPRTVEKLLRLLSALFAVQGLVWAALGSFDPWGFYDERLAMALFDASELPAEAQKSWRFAVALLGATTTGFFVLFYTIVRYALAARAVWAYPALWTALLAWFVPDTAASIAMNASFNVTTVNLPCVILIGASLLVWKGAVTSQAHD
jgi:hypothetical protein